VSNKIILPHSNGHPHVANLTKATLKTMGWEIMKHPPYSPDFTLSDRHFFGPMKVHLGGQKFQTDDKLQCSVLNWLCSQDKTFKLPASATCRDNGKMR
jgi:histone-lysine N-methyltransferase SETMAR